MKINKPVVRVMADYDCFPLWRYDPANGPNVNPSDLPIAAELARDLLGWAAVYDATLNRSDPVASGFPDAAAEADFYAEGRRLAGRLAAGLAGRYVIEYFDGRDGQARPVDPGGAE